MAEEKFINTRQIIKRNGKNKLIEVNDYLESSAHDKTYAKLHGKYSKVRFLINDYSKGTGESAVILSHNIDAVKFKYAYERFHHLFKRTMEIEEEIGIYSEMKKPTKGFEKRKEVLGKSPIYYEKKILPSFVKDASGKETQYHPTSQITISYEPFMQGKPTRMPWTVMIASGEAIAEKNTIGGTQIKSGTEKNVRRVKMFLATEDMFAIMTQTIDYIRSWENMAMQSLIPMRAKYENSERNAH